MTVMAAMLAEQLATQRSRTTVAIDGRSGAGKSTLASLLQSMLANYSVIVHMDDLYPGWNGLVGGIDRLGRDVLGPWHTTGRARFRAHNWVSSAPGPWVEVPASRILIVEGCGAGARALRRYINVLLWCQAADDPRRMSVARRDSSVPNWWTQWAQQESAHYRRDRTWERADVMYRWG